MDFEISVIVPTYNAERYIYKALMSVKTQTFSGEIELILIDDCSTDNTPKILEKFKKENPDLFVKILYQEKNMRQGTARNKGVRIAQGKYIMFLDADDFLDPNTLSLMHLKAQQHSCDFVVCDWTYFYEERGLVYVNNDEFLHQNLLIGSEVEALYKAETYFSVNKLYRKDFLLKHNIQFGEGYIYEDFEFYIQVAQHADIVGIIQNPLYRVRVNEQSTTKTNKESAIHVESLLKAVENTLKKFNPRSEYSYYHVYKYLIRKSLSYLDERAPKTYQRKSLKKVVSMLNDKKNDYPVPKRVIPLYHFLFRRKYLQNSNINKIMFVWWLYSKDLLNSIFAFALKVKWTILDTKIAKKIKRKRNLSKIQSFYKRPVKKDMILFLGFDYKYIGNSKYLFDYLKNNNTFDIYFVTKDVKVPPKYRVRPRSIEFYEKLAQAKVVILESWVPLRFIKRDGTIWIQLWHGTPLKKLFFDSHEYFISSFNKNHKRDKHRDIRRWDYLLADSPGGVEKLASAFAFEESRILEYGYPRVQWLNEHQNNDELKRKIRKSLYIPENKKVILYAPTWRDYNYKESQYDLSYLLDLNLLEKSLSDDYVIIYKPHSMEENTVYSGKVIVPKDDVDIQPLILISNLIISDYSSIIFDAIALEKPFYLFINDLEKYSHARGIYRDLGDLLNPFYVDNEKELSRKIINLHDDYPVSEYAEVKSMYSYQKSKKSCQLMESKLMKIISEKNKD